MRPQDAQDILRMIESLWQFDFGEERRKTWRIIIEGYEDAGLVTDAVFRIAEQSAFKPTVAEIKQMVAKIENDRKAANIRPTLPWPRSEIPSWVKRWYYARFIKSPPDFRFFREQFPHLPQPPSGEWMPGDLYAEESKSLNADRVVAAVSGGSEIMAMTG